VLDDAADLAAESTAAKQAAAHDLDADGFVVAPRRSVSPALRWGILIRYG